MAIVETEKRIRKIITPDLTTHGYAPHLQARYWRPVEDEFTLSFEIPVGEQCWALTWAFRVRKKGAGENAVYETGFFRDAAHIDKRGIYGLATFNYRDQLRRIQEFEPEKSAADLILGDNCGASKYKQWGDSVDWPGIVLASQVPFDRSVKSVGHPDLYWEFITEACKYYGKNLFIKLHPKTSPRDERRTREIAKEHCAHVGHTDLSILESCKFLLVYCSTMAMDAFLRGVRVAQYVPGYWHKTGAVTYTDGVLPDDVDDTVEMGHKIANWCVWRYCFNFAMPIEMWWGMLRIMAESDDPFPMTDEFCYATNMQWQSNDCGH